MVDRYARTVVLSNAEFCYQKYGETRQSGCAASAVTLGWVDHAADARATGVHRSTVWNRVEFQEELARAVGSRCIVMIDVITEPSASPPITSGDAFRRPRKPRPVAARQTSLPLRADIMTIHYVGVFLQRVACIRADDRYEFELPRAPDCAVAGVSNCVVEGRSPVTAAVIRQLVSE